MSATKNHSKPGGPRNKDRSARRAIEASTGPATDSGNEEIDGVIPFTPREPRTRPRPAALPDAAEAAEVLALVPGPANIPLDAASAQQIDAALRQAQASGLRSACLWISTGEQNLIEETYGHQVGVALMRLVEIRLRECLREDDVMCRVTNHEFAVVLSDVESVRAVAGVAERLQSQCGGVYHPGKSRLHVATHIGIAMYPSDTTEPQELMRYARMAMREASVQGGTRCHFFSPELLMRLHERAWMSAELEQALAQGRLVLHYQPQYAIDTQRVVGVEALVRLATHSGELIKPDNFIALAEETGQIAALGRWVLDKACQQLGRWRRAGKTGLRMAVNISPRQLLDEAFTDMVDAAVTRAGICHSDLELEITEGQIIEHLADVDRTLRKLTAKGVRVAVDDFGTGYSSLAYLTQLSVHAVKVDRAFMARIPDDARAGRLVSAVIAMARELGLALIAEGIETEAQHQFLLQSGCDLGQGYHFSRPQSAKQIEIFLL